MPTCRGSCLSLLALAMALCLPSLPLAAQSFNEGNPGVDRYLRLDDGLYELNADGTYHKVQGSTATSPRPSSSPSRPATTSSAGPFTGQERFMRFDDGLYERMADGSYTKVDERRLTQQSQSGNYGASSTSTDPRWQQQFGQQQQWSNGNRPQQWSNNNRPQQWSNNNRPQQWSNNRPQPGPVAVDSMLMNNTGQDRITRTPAPGRRPPAVDSMLMDGTGQGVAERAQADPWYELGRSIRRAIDAEAQQGRSGR